MDIDFDQLKDQYTRSPDVFMRTVKLMSDEEMEAMLLAHRHLIPRVPDDYGLVRILPAAYHREAKTEDWTRLNTLLDLEADMPAGDILEDAIRINRTLGKYTVKHYTEHLLALAIARISLANPG